MNNQSTMGHPIIIVDDEPEILLAVDTTLRMAGFENIITLSDHEMLYLKWRESSPALYSLI